MDTTDVKFTSKDANSANFSGRGGSLSARGLWAGLLICCLLCSATGLFASSSGCVLPKGLYQEWWRSKQKYESDRSEAASRLYRAYAYSLAEASLRGKEETFQRCLALARGDPFASLVAALVEYLHDGRRHPSAFVASFPRSKQQLADFWSLDDAVGPPREVLTALPGIPLPDGLTFKFATELFSLVQGGNRAAAREYFFLYAHSDGSYSEFMVDQIENLVVNKPQVMLSQWEAFRPYTERIASNLRGEAEYSPEDWRNEVDSLRAACREHPYPSCAEALRIFH
jgi:hypothetical protein